MTQSNISHGRKHTQRDGQKTEIALTDTAQGYDLFSEVFARSQLAPLFWRPRFIEPSAGLNFVPFVFWLVGIIRPRNTRVLGSTDGVLHFAICQAIEKLNVPGRCRGLAWWRDTAGVVPTRLRSHQSLVYEDISSFAVMGGEDEDSATADIDPADLLVADLSGIDGQTLDLDTLVGTLSSTGVLVLAGTHALSDQNKNAETSQSPLASLPHFSLDIGTGLTVVCRNSTSFPPLYALISAARHGVLPPQIEGVFRRLGDGLEMSGKDIASRQKITAQTEQLSTLTAGRKKSDAELKEVLELYGQRASRIAELQTEVFSLRQLLANEQELAGKLKDKAEALRSENRAIRETSFDGDELRATKPALERERLLRFRETQYLTTQLEEFRTAEANQTATATALRAEAHQKSLVQKSTAQLERTKFYLEKRNTEIASLKTKLQSARDMVEKRNREKAALTEKLERARQGSVRISNDMADARKAADEVSHQLAEQSRLNAQLRSEIKRLKRRMDQLMTSRSWRLTAPIRGVSSVFRR